MTVPASETLRLRVQILGPLRVWRHQFAMTASDGSTPGSSAARYPSPCRRSAYRAPSAQDQHSTTLRARPPRAVSLYLSFMSAPVSRIVLIALSSET